MIVSDQNVVERRDVKLGRLSDGLQVVQEGVKPEDWIVVNAQNDVERRDVKLGRLSDGLQVVDEGVKPEDWVIVNGIQRVRDGAKVEPKRTSMPGAAPEQTNQASKN